MNGFKSYLLFTGRPSLYVKLILSAIAFVFLIAAKIINVCAGNPDAWDFLRLLGEVIWVTGIVYVLRELSNANMKSAPGYRFFHALPDSARHYKRAVITANTSLIIGATIFAGTDLLLFKDNSPMLFAALALFSLGWMNLFGNMGIFWVYLIPIFVIGFSNGFLHGISDDGEPTGTILQSALLIVCAALCVIGVTYNLLNCGKHWNKEK